MHQKERKIPMTVGKWSPAGICCRYRGQPVLRGKYSSLENDIWPKTETRRKKASLFLYKPSALIIMAFLFSHWGDD